MLVLYKVFTLEGTDATSKSQALQNKTISIRIVVGNDRFSDVIPANVIT